LKKGLTKSSLCDTIEETKGKEKENMLAIIILITLIFNLFTEGHLNYNNFHMNLNFFLIPSIILFIIYVYF